MDKLSTERSCQYHLLQAGGTSDFRLQIVDCEFKNDSIVFQSAFRNRITHALAADGTDFLYCNLSLTCGHSLLLLLLGCFHASAESFDLLAA